MSVGCLTVSSSDKQKRKGLRGSVDLEKIKCVETVQPEPSTPQERMYAFQVDVFVSLLPQKLPIMEVKHEVATLCDTPDMKHSHWSKIRAKNQGYQGFAFTPTFMFAFGDREKVFSIFQHN